MVVHAQAVDIKLLSLSLETRLPYLQAVSDKLLAESLLEAVKGGHNEIQSRFTLQVILN